MNSLHTDLAELSPEKRTLLALDNPLSFSQQRLWFLNQWEPGSPVYHISEAVRIRGRFDAHAFAQALGEVVRRHESLRTAFPALDGRPVQVVLPSVELSVPLVDLRGLPEQEREAAARKLSRAEALRPFDLERGPLLRITLLRLGESEYAELFVMHHIVSDAWSLDILNRELATLYTRFRAGAPSPLAELEIQYADYAHWQRGRLRGETLEAELDYWRQQLGGALPVLELPTDRPRPAAQTFRGARLTRPLSKELTDALRSLSLGHGVTLFMTMLAAFKSLLHFYTRQEDLVVGTPIANRGRDELESLIGFFINTLVLRTDLSGDPTFSELLARVQRACLGAYEHQELPFEKLVDELRPERSLSHTPLFQVWFALQRASRKGGSPLPGLELEALGFEKRLAKFDLTLEVIDNDERLLTSLNYNTDLFDEATVARMQENLHALLERMAADPRARISSLTRLAEVEAHQLAIEWNDTTREAPRAECVHELFEQQAEQRPDAVALVHGDEQLTYAELNRRANQLARHLRKLGVGAESRVGVCLERSSSTIVALLATLKAGGVYLPLDPEYPEDRLNHMLTDAQPSVLLTEQQLVYGLPAYAAVSEIVCLDTDWPEFERLSGENLRREALGGNLAYVIYTSGSTGGPKGVGVSHAAAVDHLAGVSRAFGVSASDRALQFASTAFDVSLEQILTTLCVGACLVLRGAQFWSASDLAREMREKSLTVVNLPTAYWQQLGQEWQQQAAREAERSTLRLLIAGGEAMSAEAALRWRRGPHGSARLLNAYGPTEAVITASVYEAGGSHPLGPGSAPIGRPLDNRSGHVLDRRQRLVPLGARGELCLGGRPLARGYLNRPELTAERFVPDPFSTEPGARLYRTGDLTRRLSDGQLEYLGRVDYQLKVRGFRIEPGEIEDALRAHDSVRDCVVVAREDDAGGKRLVAYVVAEEGRTLAGADLQSFLKGRLPEYMSPAAFVTLKTLPLTPNGKVDRRALPEPEQSRPELEEDYVAPRTQLEEALCAVWSEVLGVGRVGVHDNFFELGGDSILSLQVIARARRLGMGLSPKQLFERPTVAALAASVTSDDSVFESHTPEALTHAESGQDESGAPLAPIQRWFFERELADASHWNMAVLFEVPSEADPALLRDALQRVVDHHDALRTRFRRDESTEVERASDGWRQYEAPAGSEVPFDFHDLSTLGEEKGLAALERAASELQAGLDIERGPVVRGAHFILGGGRGARLLVVIHHLVVDAVSWRILTEDLTQCYEQLRRGEAVGLAAKTTSYRRWAEALAEYARGRELVEEVAYWHRVARHDGARLSLDFPGGENNAGSARKVTARLGAEETERLLRETSKRGGVRVQEVLLAALGRVLCGRAGGRAVKVDVEGHGREEFVEGIDATRTVGWFTTLYPVWLECGEVSESESLRVVKEAARGVPHGGIGYGVLKYLAGAREELDEGEPAQVSFNYLGRFGATSSNGDGAAPLLRTAVEGRGPTHGPRGARAYLLDVNASVVGAQLQVTFGYSENLHSRETIEALAREYVGAVSALLDHCQTEEARAFTPADFPLLNLNQQQLDGLMAKIGKTKVRQDEH